MDKLKRSSAPATILALLLFCAPLVFAFGVPYYPTGFYGWFEPEEEYVQLIWDDNDPEDEVDYYCVQRADDLDGGASITPHEESDDHRLVTSRSPLSSCATDGPSNITWAPARALPRTWKGRCWPDSRHEVSSDTAILLPPK